MEKLYIKVNTLNPKIKDGESSCKVTVTLYCMSTEVVKKELSGEQTLMERENDLIE